MKLLFDTNIVLDLLLDRKPFVSEASQLFALLEQSKLNGLISATTVTTIFYLASKVLDNKTARQSIENLMSLFEIAAVNRPVLEEAIKLECNDFEDAVLYQAAHHAGANAIISRDKQFKGLSKHSKNLPIYAPGEFLKILSQFDQEKV